nr:unnamed protein product [Callosobruchus analis]
MPNTSSSVPFLLSSSMQSIRSRRPSAALGGSQGGSAQGLLSQLGSGMVSRLGGSGGGMYQHQHQQQQPPLGFRKCPSLNITFS